MDEKKKGMEGKKKRGGRIDGWFVPGLIMDCTIRLLNGVGWDDCFSVMASIASVLLFTYSLRLIGWLTRKMKGMLPGRERDDERLASLRGELEQTRSDMEALSPTSQFAAYFKKERNLKQLTAQLDTLIMERKKEAGLISTLLWISVGMFVQLVAILLMLYSRNTVMGHVNATYFWPFNFLLYIPNYWPPKEQQQSDAQETTPITLFAFLSLVTFVWQTADRRADGNKMC